MGLTVQKLLVLLVEVILNTLHLCFVLGAQRCQIVLHLFIVRDGLDSRIVAQVTELQGYTLSLGIACRYTQHHCQNKYQLFHLHDS